MQIFCNKKNKIYSRKCKIAMLVKYFKKLIKKECAPKKHTLKDICMTRLEEPARQIIIKIG